MRQSWNGGRGQGTKYMSQGMNWIRPVKRLAIYLRDGLACVYCGSTVEDDRLTLDHITPNSKGGSNDATNLVTCCNRCNASRGNRSVKSFAVVVAAYLDRGLKAETILAHVRTTSRRELNVGAAKDLIARRGGFSKAIRAAA